MQKIISKVLSILLLTSIFFGLGNTEILASQKFHQGNLSTGNLKSPARNTSGNDLWPHINSAWNQPRSVGTNPHNGTDLDMKAGVNVYSVFPGTIVQKGTDWMLVKHSTRNFYMVKMLEIKKSRLYLDSKVYFCTVLLLHIFM